MAARLILMTILALCAAGGAAFAHAAREPVQLGMSRPPAQRPYVEGEMLVKFRAGVTPEQIARLNALHGCTIAESLSGLGIHRLRLPAGVTVPEMVARYEASGLVEFAEPNHRVSIPPMRPIRPVGPLEERAGTISASPEPATPEPARPEPSAAMPPAEETL